MTVKELENKAMGLRLDALTSINKAGAGASGSCMSVVEILTALYYGEVCGRPVLKMDPQKPGWDGQDYFVLSKGKAAPVLYSILADKGFFAKEELDYFAKDGAMLKARPDVKIPGITASVPSYGHGLSIALGMALSLKVDRRGNRVFVALGDGELQEGQIWEAAMAAANFKLDNLVAIIDNNKVQGGDMVSSVMDLGNIQDKFESFGWNVIQVMDGHNFDHLLDAVSRAFTTNRKPVCIWCHTVAGKGIDFAERKPGYLDVPLSDGELLEVCSNYESLKNNL